MRTLVRVIRAACVSVCVAAAPVWAQQPPPLPPVPLPTGGPDNVSVDAVISALYASISGDSGVARNWDRFRALFHPSARLFQHNRGARVGVGPVLFTVEDYVARVGPQMLRRGFYEREVHRETAAMGRLVHAFSTYESRVAPSDATAFDSGINSIQLVSDGAKWWILQIGWVSTTPDTPIPAKYRGGAPP